MQRPSSAKLWQMPHPAALPTIPGRCPRPTPLEAHDTSYFAASANIFSFSSVFSVISAYDGVDSRNRRKRRTPHTRSEKSVVSAATTSAATLSGVSAPHR